MNKKEGLKLIEQARKIYARRLTKCKDDEDPIPFMLQAIRNDFVIVDIPPPVFATSKLRSVMFHVLARRAEADRARACVFSAPAWLRSEPGGETEEAAAARRREMTKMYGESYEFWPDRIEIVTFNMFTVGGYMSRGFRTIREWGKAPTLGDPLADHDIDSDHPVAKASGNMYDPFIAAFKRIAPL